MDSIWKKTIRLPKFEPLRRDICADVLVIGGGLAGLLCAHELSRAGVHCVLAEAGRLCGGVTGNTTAKLTIQHGLIYHKLFKRLGRERTRAYLEANQAALKRIQDICLDIPCDFEEKPNYVYALDSRKELDKEMAALDKLGCPADFVSETPLPFPVAGAVRLDRQAQFHPLKFAAAIAEGLQIYEHTRVLEVKTGEAAAEGGTIKADHIVVATHFPFLNKFGCYWLKLYQSRSYVLALENGPDLDGMYLDQSGKGLSFRNYNGLLLLGGPGLHDAGRRALYRPVFPQASQTVYHHRLQQMGNDLFHGRRQPGDRPDPGPGQSVSGGFCPLPLRAPSSARRKRRRERFKPAHPHPAPVPSYGLRPKIQRTGAFLGLPLSRLPVRGGRAVAGRPRHWKFRP